MLTVELIHAIRTLIARAKLMGDEVPAFNLVVQALDAEEVMARQRAAASAFVAPPAELHPPETAQAA